jgi:hypothetical protein
MPMGRNNGIRTDLPQNNVLNWENIDGLKTRIHLIAGFLYKTGWDVSSKTNAAKDRR